MNNLLKNIVEHYLEEHHVLIDISSDQRSGFIRVIIDSENDITLDDTAILTKKLIESNDIETLFPDGFRLEVTTPGVGQPLSFPFQYKKNINRDLTLQFNDSGEEKLLVGKILSADNSQVEIVQKDVRVSVPYDQIISANINVSFK